MHQSTQHASSQELNEIWSISVMQFFPSGSLCDSSELRLSSSLEILLTRAGLDKLADCRKIKCGIFALKLAFRKNSNCLPRHVLEAAETWLSLAPDRISVPYGCHPPTSASNQHYEVLPFYFCFSVLNSVPLDNLI